MMPLERLARLLLLLELAMSMWVGVLQQVVLLCCGGVGMACSGP